MLVGHPNYEGLEIRRKADGSLNWVTTKNSEVGALRIAWANKKAGELGLKIEPGVYAKVMLEVHPTKIHVCQICGSEMSIYYIYPSANLLKALYKKFGFEFSELNTIHDIWDQLLEFGVSENEIIDFLNIRFSLDVRNINKEDYLSKIEQISRLSLRGQLSPGAMSNFPDRFDGYHTYNRCCRPHQDTGRSKENLKSYSRDRRAYEYWSDGNIHAANLFMGSSFFEGTSADHIGPISLGFVHDPRYIRPMEGGSNSAKRDRLQFHDVEEIISIQKSTNVYPMSWYSRILWDFIVDNYKAHPHLLDTVFKNMLKQNMVNFMFVLHQILLQGGEPALTLVVETLIQPKYEDFHFSYEFNDLGIITKQSPRRFTERSANEFKRLERISIDSIYEFNEKLNRSLNPHLEKKEIQHLEQLINSISTFQEDEFISSLDELMAEIQLRIIKRVLAENTL